MPQHATRAWVTAQGFSTGGGGSAKAVETCVVDAAGNGDYTTIDAAHAAGKRQIYLRSGTYTLAASLDFGTTGSRIIGEDRYNTVITLGAGINLTWSAWYGQIENVRFHQTGTGYLVVSGANNVVQDTWHSASGSSARVFQISGNNNRFINNVVINTAASGIYGVLVSGSSNIISGGHYELAREAFNDGCFAITGTYNTITGNHIAHTTGSNYPTIGCNNTGTRITNNTFVASSTTPVWVKSGIANTIVSDNVFAYTNTYGVHVQGSNTIVANNRFQQVASGSAIHLNGVSNCVIQGNIIDGSSTADGRYAIRLLGTGTDNLIIGNRTHTIQYGLYIGVNTLTRTNASSNILTGCGTGLYEAGTQTTLSGNTA